MKNTMEIVRNEVNKPLVTDMINQSHNGGRKKCMTDEQIEKARRMYGEGFSYRRIGLTMGVSYNTVRRYLL